jgi:hypothetical protein
MTALRSTLALALAVALAASAPAAAPAKRTGKKTHHHAHAVHGVVVAVHHDKDKDRGTITVRVSRHRHHRKTASASRGSGSASQHHTVTFTVDRGTKFEKVVHKGGKTHHEHASFRSVHKGEHVLVFAAKGDRHEAGKVDVLGEGPHHARGGKPPRQPGKTPGKKNTRAG